MSGSIETITLGGGCFWCTEAVYERVRGVSAVESGYCNGHVEQPQLRAGVRAAAPATPKWCA